MRSITFLCVATILLLGCASDRALTAPSIAPAATASLVTARGFVRRCPLDGGTAYDPFVVVDGRVYPPGEWNARPQLLPSEIERIELLKGDAAVARYGALAGTVGVMIVTTRHGRGASARPAS